MSELLSGRKASPPPDLDYAVDADYARHIFFPAWTANAPMEREYQAAGDTLTIGKVRGNPCLQVRFTQQQPWIDVSEGDVIRRKFGRVYIRDTRYYETSGASDALPTAYFYTSYGPLRIAAPNKPTGIRAGFQCMSPTLLANTAYSFAEVAGLAGHFSDIGGDGLGGPLVLKVLSSSPSALAFGWFSFASYVAPPLLNHFILDAGETLVLDTDNFMGRYRSNTASLPVSCMRFQPALAGLNCELSIIYTPGALITDTAWMTGVLGRQPFPE